MKYILKIIMIFIIVIPAMSTTLETENKCNKVYKS